MKLNKLLIGALLAVGSALGAGVQAQSVNYSMHWCCLGLQADCDAVYGEGSPRCAGVYSRCMQGRYCIIP